MYFYNTSIIFSDIMKWIVLFYNLYWVSRLRKLIS